MVGWYHQLNGHEFEQTPGDSEGQGSLECWSPRGRKESATTGQLNNSKALSQAGKPRLGHKEEGAFVTTQFQKHYTKPRHILAFKFFSHVSYGKVCFFFKILIVKILLSRGFNGGSVIKTPKFHCRNMGSNPVWGSSACHKVQPRKKPIHTYVCVCVCVCTCVCV